MDTKIPTIQHELERRFSLTYTEPKDKEGRVDLTVNYLRVYDYIHYIESASVLSQLMDEEFDRRRKYVTWIIMQQNFPDTTPNTPPEDTHRELNQALNYACLYKDIYERTGQFNSETTLELTKNKFLTASRAKKEFLQRDNNKKRGVLGNILWNLTIKNKNLASYKLKDLYQDMIQVSKNCSFAELSKILNEVRTYYERNF